MARPRGEWARSALWGLWLCVVGVWPAQIVSAGKTVFLWQPLLVVSLLAFAVAQARAQGWAPALGQGLFLYVIVTLAGWVPMLPTTVSSPDFSYPAVYVHYLQAYVGAVAALVAYQAMVAALARPRAWWPSGPWSRPLVVTPILLLGRGVLVGHWIGPLVGVGLGAGLALLAPWRRWGLIPRGRRWRLAPWGLLGVATLLTLASGLRIYRQTGADFPRGSDDGDSFYGLALVIAEDPTRIWTPPPIDTNFFSAYYPLMGLWFRAVGAHLPSWLGWQGLAAGLLAVVVYSLGRRLRGRLVGLIAAGLVMADHVMLHLMATLNMEVFFIPALYLALWLWVSVNELPLPQRRLRAFFAGSALAMATLFRPTALLIPVVWWLLLCVERPRLPWSQARGQGVWMTLGFVLPMGLSMIRHRLAWGHWMLTGGSNGAGLSWYANYAWEVNGRHPYEMGWAPWLRLVASDPSVIWTQMIPDWWAQIVCLWTHRGFGQMDLVQGLNYPGPYQAALVGILTVGVVVGAIQAIRQRRRLDLVLLALPLYFTGLALVYYVINTRYRAPFLPALYLVACAGFAGIFAAIRSPSSSVMSAPTSRLPRPRDAALPAAAGR